jgi:hypothetical protein
MNVSLGFEPGDGKSISAGFFDDDREIIRTFFQVIPPIS